MSLTNENESTSNTRGSSRRFGSCNYNAYILFLLNCDCLLIHIVSFVNWYRKIITRENSRFCWYAEYREVFFCTVYEFYPTSSNDSKNSVTLKKTLTNFMQCATWQHAHAMDKKNSIIVKPLTCTNINLLRKSNN